MTDLERRLASLDRQTGYLMDIAAEAQKFAEKQVKINAALADRLAALELVQATHAGLLVHRSRENDALRQRLAELGKE